LVSAATFICVSFISYTQNISLALLFQAFFAPSRQSQTGQAGTKREKAFWYPDFTNRPDQKTKGLNPGDSANPNTTINLCLFCMVRMTARRFSSKTEGSPFPHSPRNACMLLADN
jgi:hypothetical protein